MAANQRRVAYFGSDCTDRAAIKRIDQFRSHGYEVVGAMFRRNVYARNFVPHWNNIDLGTTEYFRYLRRIFIVARALWRLFRRRKIFRSISFFYARNLDNAILASLTKLIARSRAPLVYEVLDIPNILLAQGPVSALFRRAERLLLQHCKLLVVSSPSFLDRYFEARQAYRGESFLLENKMPRSPSADPLVRPTFLEDMPHGANGRWVIGWFGLLDCQESWNLLNQLARALPERLEIYLRGYPALLDVEDFHKQIATLTNITFEGEFRNPGELASMHRMVDMIWTFDFKGNGGNSEWLLPNNLYDAGFFGKPALARCQDTVGEFVTQHDLGWVFDDPVGEHLERFLSRLSLEEYRAKRQSLAAAPSSLFVETDEIERLCQAITRETN